MSVNESDLNEMAGLLMDEGVITEASDTGGTSEEDRIISQAASHAADNNADGRYTDKPAFGSHAKTEDDPVGEELANGFESKPSQEQQEEAQPDRQVQYEELNEMLGPQNGELASQENINNIASQLHLEVQETQELFASGRMSEQQYNQRMQTANHIHTELRAAAVNRSAVELQQNQNHLMQQRQMDAQLSEAIPEWGNATAQGRQRITIEARAYLEGQGMSEQDMSEIKTVSQMKFVFDQMRADRTRREASARRTVRRAQAERKAKKAGRVKATQKKYSSGHKQDELDEVAELLARTL